MIGATGRVYLSGTESDVSHGAEARSSDPRSSDGAVSEQLRVATQADLNTLVRRIAVTEAAVRRAPAAGARLVVGPQAVVTPLA